MTACRRVFPLVALHLTLLSAALLLPEANAKQLPKVLIIGDSISMGYTPVVKELLKGKAVVQRPSGNCQSTDHGLKNILEWLGDEEWDVIYFNWGIWDTHYLYSDGEIVSPEVDICATDDIKLRNEPEQYEANLIKLITVLQERRADLIWATTTPCIASGTKRFRNIVQYNKVANSVMQKYQVQITDLYSAALPNRLLWQQEDTCHFNARGNRELGKIVGRRILEVLEHREGTMVDRETANGR